LSCRFTTGRGCQSLQYSYPLLSALSIFECDAGGPVEQRRALLLELLKGSTLIKGETGTSVGRVLQRAPVEESPIPTLEPTATTKPSVTSTESAAPTAEPSATSSASRNAGPDGVSSSAVPTTAAPPSR
jgi:hypothetical protein